MSTATSSKTTSLRRPTGPASAAGSSPAIRQKHDDNEQLGIIVRGALDFRIVDDEDDQSRDVLGAHQAYLAPKGVWHGQSIFVGDDEYDECWILDVFSPPRDDLRESESVASGGGVPTDG